MGWHRPSRLATRHAARNIPTRSARCGAVRDRSIAGRDCPPLALAECAKLPQRALFATLWPIDLRGERRPPVLRLSEGCGFRGVAWSGRAGEHVQQGDQRGAGDDVMFVDKWQDVVEVYPFDLFAFEGVLWRPDVFGRVRAEYVVL